MFWWTVYQGKNLRGTYFIKSIRASVPLKGPQVWIVNKWVCLLMVGIILVQTVKPRWQHSLFPLWFWETDLCCHPGFTIWTNIIPTISKQTHLFTNQTLGPLPEQRTVRIVFTSNLSPTDLLYHNPIALLTMLTLLPRYSFERTFWEC